MSEPASVTFDGTDLVLWVPSLESIEYPGLSELTDPSVLDMSCYFSDTGWAPVLTEAAITDNRLCSSTDFSGPGRKGYALPLMYVFNPEEPTEDEARITLVEDSLGYFVERPGVPFDQDLAAGDLVRCYAVKLGRQHEAGRTANSPWLIQQQAYLRPPGTTSALVQVAAS